MWYARSDAFYNLPVIQWLGIWRAVPDTIIILFGALPLAWFLLSTYPRLRKANEALPSATDEPNR